MNREAVRRLATRLFSMHETECAVLLDLVATRMALIGKSGEWISIRDAVRRLPAVSHIGSGQESNPALDRVLGMVEARTGIGRRAIMSRMAGSRVSLARHMAMVFFRESERLTQAATSEQFGRCTSSTWAAERELRDRYETSVSERALIDAVRQDLGLPRWTPPGSTAVPTHPPAPERGLTPSQP